MRRQFRQHEDKVAKALATGQAARSPIAASWARSALIHGLDPGQNNKGLRLSQSEFHPLYEAFGAIIRLARPTLERLLHASGGCGGNVLLANPAGIPLERLGHPSEDADFAAAGLWTGTIWSEAAMGTNGIGTCIAEARPVLIHQDQHFLSCNTGLTCACAPIHAPSGDVIAVLDISTARPEFSEGMSGLLSYAVLDAARRIEADLFCTSFPGAKILLVSGAARGPGALLALDTDDLVIGATKSARQQLGLQGDLARHPLPAADLLGLESHQRPEDGERAVLIRAIARAGGNLSAAARLLGISRATLHRKLGRAVTARPAHSRLHSRTRNLGHNQAQDVASAAPDNHTVPSLPAPIPAPARALEP